MPDVLTLEQLAARFVLLEIRADTLDALFSSVAAHLERIQPGTLPLMAITVSTHPDPEPSPDYSAAHSAPNPNVMTPVPASWKAGVFVRRKSMANERLEILRAGDALVYVKGVPNDDGSVQDNWVPVDALELVP